MKKYYTNKKWSRAFAGSAIAAAFVLGLTACTDTKPTDDKSAVEAVAAIEVVENTGADAVAIVQIVYNGFAVGDMNMVTSVMSPDIIWNEAEGNPYADKNPYVGPDAILSGVFARIGGEWTNFTATPSEFVTQGNRVVV
ncbi:MAG: nuclear transport factor 2 family protein, partial [Robiginitomaculum sp.]|nr:nuclear transport factor 2 family protein [Robiginitomaculum sp.]